MTLRSRILLLILFAVVPIILVEAYSEAQLRRSRQDELSQEAVRLMRAAAAEQGRISESARQLLIAFSEGKEVRSEDWAACGEAAARVLGRIEGYVNLGVSTAEGDLLCSGLPRPEGKDMRRPGFVRELTQAGQLFVGRYHVGLITDKAVLTLAVPLTQTSAAGQLLAWINLDLNWLAQHYAERFDSSNLTLLIADRQGTVLVRLPDNNKWAGKPMGEQFSSLLNASQEGVVETVGIDGEQRYIAYSPISSTPVGFYLGVGLSKAAYMQPINERTLWAAQISLAILLLAMIAAWIVGNISIRRPIDRLLRTAGVWQRGDFSARAALPKDRSELSKLGLAFDEMAAAVESRERNIGLLVRELEHRGGNLLGIVQAMAATTLRGNNIEQAREAFTSRLLALARSNRMFNASKGEPIDLMEVARSELSLFPDRVSIRGGSVLLTPAIAQKYTLALHELVTNATKYGALTTSTGTIDVSWSVERAARGSVLKLKWQERGGPPAQAPSSKGFGTRLIKSSFPDAKLTFATDGLICELQVDLAQPRA